MKDDSNEQHSEIIAHSDGKRHANEDAVKQNSHFQEKYLHDSFLMQLFGRENVVVCAAFWVVLTILDSILIALMFAACIWGSRL